VKEVIVILAVVFLILRHLHMIGNSLNMTQKKSKMLVNNLKSFRISTMEVIRRKNFYKKLVIDKTKKVKDNQVEFLAQMDFSKR
jgi:hypothetical protein